MAIDIEQFEKEMAKAREAVKKNGCDSGVIKIPGGLVIPRPQRLTRIGEKEVTIRALPIEIVGYSESSVLARAIMFEMCKIGCALQSRTAIFREPAVVREDGVFIQEARGSNRIHKVYLVPFDPRVVFSGGRQERNMLKSKGISFR